MSVAGKAEGAMLELRGVCAGYGPVQVLTDVSLHIAPGEIVTIIGANGAGKTTTLSTISGIVHPTRGEIYLHGQRVNGMTPEQGVRLGIGHVPERRQLFASMSVLDNLLLGAYHRYRRTPKAELERDLAEVFQLFPILSQRRRQLAATLSGGEQQMLAIGRGLMSRPKLLLLDEPSLGLAPMVIREVMRVIEELKGLGLTLLLVEQNARAALQVADRCYVMENGRIVMEGTPEKLAADHQIQAAYLGHRKLEIRHHAAPQPPREEGSAARS
jgi:branched-chain amino acid transport system ATP-binding protein